MLKNLTTFLLLMPLSFALRAQDSAISLSSGITEDGGALMVSYNYYLKNDNFIQGSVFMSFAKDPYLEDISVPYNNFTVNAGYFHKVIKSRNNLIKASIGLGAVFGYEAINKGDRELSNGALISSESGFIYGAFGGFDMDIFLNENFSAIVKANQYYHHNSEIGQFTPFVGGGIRYFFN